jgi:2-keto-4-pentenoate hydratase/2-oxohepta-3-ene-1,7-dioic acid hydratase in catechol pathway
MRLLRLGEQGQESPAVIDDAGQVYDLAPFLRGRDFDGSFFEGDGIDQVREALGQGRLQALSVDGRRIGAPIARPSAVICIGQNYAAHATESGTSPPEAPIMFFKHPNTVVGPFDDVAVPLGSSTTDWEVELGVVIGRRCRYLSSPSAAALRIAGYCVSNDISERNWQLQKSGGQWSKGKCCETFNPLGPWLVPASEVPDPQNLRLRSWVNGEARQDSTTADMIFPVFELVWQLSQFLVLDPGDLINTGTPQGVALSGRFPYLANGDVMTLEIEKLGRQEQHLVSASLVDSD